MKKNLIYTKSNARLTLLIKDDQLGFNWIFVPGGPGLGSEYLTSLTDILSLPGSTWLLDFPGDGSNNTEDDEQSFSNWSEGLMESVKALEQVILVAHSSGGMFALATPELENDLVGLVLMDSAPNSDWQNYFMEHVKTHVLPETEKLQKAYQANPSNKLLKELTIASIPYFSLPSSQNAIRRIFESLPFNYKTHLWAEKNFDPTYRARWIPKNIPTLIFSGDHDYLTPLHLFQQIPEFQRHNILIHPIKNASHFPWIDNPQQVKQEFDAFCQWLRKWQDTELC